MMYPNLTEADIYITKSHRGALGRTEIPLGLYYEGLVNRNPYSDKRIDPEFVSEDGIATTKYLLRDMRYTTLEMFMREFGDIKVLNVYLLPDYLEHIQERRGLKGVDTHMILKGVVRKYWTEEPNPKRRSCIEYRDKQQKHFQKLFEKIQPENIPFTCHPSLIVYENIIGHKISLNHRDIIFEKYTLTPEIPFLRYYDDDYLGAKVKILKTSVSPDQRTTADKCISTEILQKLTKRIPIPNPYTYPEMISNEKTLCFAVFDAHFENYALLYISDDTRVKVIFQKMLGLPDFTDTYVRPMLVKCKRILKELSTNSDYGHIGEPIPDIFQVGYASLHYEFAIPTYNRAMLVKIFRNLYTHLMVVREDAGKDTIQLLSRCLSDTTNPKHMYSFVAKLHTIQLTDVDIQRLLCDRFGITMKHAKEVYQECRILHESHRLKIDKQDPELVIFVRKRVDDIQIELQGARSMGEISETMRAIVLSLAVYCQKINYPKKVVLAKEINELCQENANLRNIREKYRCIGEPSAQDVSPEDISEQQDVSVDISDDADAESDISDIPDDESDASDIADTDSDGSFGKFSSDSSQEGAGKPVYHRKIAKALKDEGEENFTNNRYFLNRLEQRDPKLFRFKTKDGVTYSRKCQSSNNTQPLVVTRQELNELNREFKKLNPKHKDLYYTEKGKEYELRGFHIDGRDPNIIYLCPEYWDRKNQLILDPNLRETDNHPIDGVPMKDIIHSKKARDESRYVLMRNNGKYELSFIQNIHPDGYALPCCGKKPVEYKVGAKIFVHEGTEWVMGTVVTKIDEEGYYRVRVKNDEMRVHVSMLDRKRGVSRNLSQGFPLLRGNKGMVSVMIQTLFKMPSDFPLFSDKNSFGCYRIGVTQGRDAFLEAFLTLMVNQDAIESDITVATLKQKIIQDMREQTIAVNEISDGAFVQNFRTVEFESPHTYSFAEFSKGFSKPFDKMGPYEKHQTLHKFSEISAIANFEKYLNERDSSLSEETLAPVLCACWNSRKQSHVFSKKQKNSLACLVFHEHNEKIKLSQYGSRKHEAYALFYKKDGYCEPMLAFFEGKINGVIQPSGKPAKITKESYVVYEDTVAKVVDIKGDTAIVDIKDTDERDELSLSECIAYNIDVFHTDLKAIARQPTRSQASVNESPPLSVIHGILEKIPHTRIQFAYLDPYNKITHIAYKHKQSYWVFPIKPDIPDPAIYNKSIIKDIYRLNNVKPPIQIVIEYLKKVDEELRRLGSEYKGYLSGAKILLSNNNYSSMLFQNGSMIPLKKEPYIASTAPKLQTYENMSLWHLTTHYQPEIGEKMREFQRTCQSQTDEILNQQKQFSELYVDIKSTKALREIMEVKSHPVMLPIRKRIKILEIVRAYVKKYTYSEIILKRFVELLYLCHDISDVSDAILRYSRECMYLGESDPSTLQFTQRQLLNEDHFPYFVEQSLYKREVPYYGVQSHINSQIKSQKKDTSETLVSLYTKYPNQLQTLFGKVQVYTHIVDESHSPTAMDIVEYGVGLERVKAEVLKAELLRVLANVSQDIVKDLIEEYNTHIVVRDLYRDISEIIEDVSQDDYNLQVGDYKILSLILLHQFGEKMGFAIYTNRYKTRETDFDLVFAIHDEVLKGDLDEIRLVTLYEDYPRDPIQKPSLKNIVTYDRRGTQTVGELSESLAFKRRFQNLI